MRRPDRHALITSGMVLKGTWWLETLRLKAGRECGAESCCLVASGGLSASDTRNQTSQDIQHLKLCQMVWRDGYSWPVLQARRRKQQSRELPFKRRWVRSSAEIRQKWTRVIAQGRSQELGALGAG